MDDENVKNDFGHFGDTHLFELAWGFVVLYY
jgi:hypothetical protein